MVRRRAARRYFVRAGGAGVDRRFSLAHLRASLLDSASRIDVLQVPARIGAMRAAALESCGVATAAMPRERKESQQHVSHVSGLAVPAAHWPRAARACGLLRFYVAAMRGWWIPRDSASKRAGTNPTAAAIGALKILGALDETRG